jgi:hypothetical protein
MDNRRVYPMPAPPYDSRFSFGLLIDTAKVLERHGYTRPTSEHDLVALQDALFKFLYALTPISDTSGS